MRSFIAPLVSEEVHGCVRSSISIRRGSSPIGKNFHVVDLSLVVGSCWRRCIAVVIRDLKSLPKSGIPKNCFCLLLNPAQSFLLFVCCSTLLNHSCAIPSCSKSPAQNPNRVSTAVSFLGLRCISFLGLRCIFGNVSLRTRTRTLLTSHSLFVFPWCFPVCFPVYSLLHFDFRASKSRLILVTLSYKCDRP